MLVNSILDLVGETPLLKVNNIIKNHKLKADLYVKLEMFNVSGSIKTRIVKSIILDGIKSGKINKDTIIIEATSGNTGIAIACLCASLNLKSIIVMPENASQERISIIKQYGSKVILTDKSLGMIGARKQVGEIEKSLENVFVVSQFENSLNPLTHQHTTAVELYNDLNGEIDVVITGIGSGGTITGIANYLHLRGNTKIIGVEPEESPLISKGISNIHKIEGIGANFIPKILDIKSIDEIVRMDYEGALKGLEILAVEEGVFVGISSGAAFMVGLIESLKEENYNKNIVVILPDSGERYLSKME